MKRKATKSDKSEDWHKYKQLRNKVNNLKKQAKEKFYNNIENAIIEADTNNPKLYWELIKHFIKSNKNSEKRPPLKTITPFGENTYAFTGLEKANCMNEYFASISSVDDTNINLPVFSQKTENSLYTLQILESDIADVIQTLIENKASGEDQISHKILKGTCNSIKKPLSILYNRSLRECKFPSLWKSGMVMPLYKKGPSELPSNYRPVSLLCAVGKVMERVVFKYLYNFFQINNLIYPYQSGFIPGHSTVYQLIDIYHQICQSIDAKQHTCMVFCDISKAFDRVWHKGLIFKLRQNGIHGELLSSISDYLSQRKQKVFIGSSMSDFQFLSAGVPQGSVLGPLFFLIYVNDIADNLLSITRLFADDTSIASSSSNLMDIEGILNHDLRCITLWAKQWLVSFNPNKTEAILFSTVAVFEPRLIFDNTELVFVDNHKHLGLTFSSDCKWHTHIDNILASASRMLGVLRNLKFRLGRKALNQIYLSYLRPLLEYAAVVWDGCTLYEKRKMEQVQY